MNARGRGRIRLLGLFGVAAFLVLGVHPVASARAESFSFDHTSGRVGDAISLHGAGWTSSDEDVQIFRPQDDSQEDAPWMRVPVVDGAFDLQTTVPPAPWGRGRFYACQVCTFSGDAVPSYTAYFTVMATVRFDQTHGSPGSTIGVSGDGWSPTSGPVKVFASVDESADETKILTSLEPDSNGTLEAGGTLHVPVRDPGPMVFFACQLCPEKPGGPSAEAPFEITEVPVPVETQTLTLDRKSAAPGDELAASGTGWSDTAGDVSVYADEAAMRAGADPLGAAPSIGGAFATSVTVPQTDASPLVMYACQQCGDSDLVATFTLAIDPGVVLNPRLSVYPSSGRVGSEVRVIGTGWQDEPVGLFMRLPGAKAGMQLGRAPTEGGAFDRTFRVPDLRVGPVVIVGCQECMQRDRQSVEVAFAVVAAAQDPPTLVVDPSSAKPGDSVKVTGAGWLPADGEVTVYVDPVAASEPTTVWFHTSPDAEGSISSAADLPDSDAGDYRVYACQRCDDTRTFPYQTAALVIEGGGGRGLGALVVLVVVGIAIWRIFFHDSSSKVASGGSSTSSPPAPHVMPIPDLTFDMEVRPDPGPDDSHVPQGFDVFAVPDTALLADRVEVTP